MIEANNINKSLTTLGICISRLAATELKNNLAASPKRKKKKAKADASAEEPATKPKRKRVAKPNVTENDSSTAGEPEEKL